MLLTVLGKTQFSLDDHNLQKGDYQTGLLLYNNRQRREDMDIVPDNSGLHSHFIDLIWSAWAG